MSVWRVPITIADGANDSSAFQLPSSTEHFALVFPAGFDGTQITFKSSVGPVDSSNYYPVHNPVDGSLITYEAAASRSIPIGDELVAFEFLKVSAVTAQTGITTLYVVGRG
jgi:hypothetical protein